MIFRFVPHSRVLDYSRLGWHIADTLDGTNHGSYAILMQWMCGCRPVEPKDRIEARHG